MKYGFHLVGNPPSGTNIETKLQISSNSSCIRTCQEIIIIRRSVVICLRLLTNNDQLLTMSETVIKNKQCLNRQTGYIDSLSLKTPEQLEEAVDQFVSDIQQTAWHTTSIRRKVKLNYPVKIRDKINEKRKSRKTWQHTRSPVHKTYLEKDC